MSYPHRDVAVVGGGAFGAATALALARRGSDVVLIDRGPLPHPDASSTDISKIIRMDYGDDDFYASLAELALARWREWNARLEHSLYHEIGFLLLSEGPLEAGGFERESRRVLAGMGHPVQSLDLEVLRRRFPAWSTGTFPGGYFNPTAGWAESGHAVSAVVAWCRAEGVEIREGTPVAELVEDGRTVRGIRDGRGGVHSADHVVVAGGAWTTALLPWTAPFMTPVGQPVYHFAPEDTTPFQPDVFPVWAADISRTGWYGFPAQRDGIVKVANHGAGIPLDPLRPPEVPPEYEKRCRAFLRSAIPELSDAPIVRRRLCLYCDTADGDFWIDRDPDRSGLTVAAGGSGHGFKFLPVIGDIVADAVEGVANPWLERFQWREPGRPHAERARYHGHLL